jgi:sugar/nucleoside kinase (ribokinase family)
MRRGLFVGLVTLDLIYLTADLPQPNQKLVALDYTMAAGGPATNAAVAFRHLGNQATVLGIVGNHPMRQMVVEDLRQQQVAIADLAPTHPDPLPTSSILVTQSTGERAVISLNAVKTQARASQIPPHVLAEIDVVLIDGHQMEVGGAIAVQAREQGIPVVVDGGSWKPNFAQVLSHVDYAICSANFYPPSCRTSQDVLDYLIDLGIPQIAITHGENPIQYHTKTGAGEIAVPAISAIDTSGAGDIFHGAFCHYMLQDGFVAALRQAAQVSAQACQSFGTRRWMQS